MNKGKLKQITKFAALSLCIPLTFGVADRTALQNVHAATITQGIDVSKWQGNINWAEVAKNNVSFAFIRVGTTRKGIDPNFYYNVLAAQTYGIKTGVYIYSYATSVEEAALEAQFVLDAVKNLKITYPIVWDIEDDVQAGLSKETLSLMANTFCAIVEAEGYYPMVYSNKNWFTKKIGPVFYDKWVAQWGAKCDIPDASVWQYSETGAISGINGNVDLNFALKDYSSQIIDTGWVAKGNYLHYYQGYKMQKGWINVGTDRYFLDARGRMVTGWLPTADGIYFLQNNGIMAVGFTNIGNGIYFFDFDGKMLTGLQSLNGLMYLFGDTGAMYTGFMDFPEGKRYFAPDGHMVTGLQAIGDGLYLFNENGFMQTGFINLNGNSYLFLPDGKMFTGWYTDGNISRYYEIDGHMAVGLVEIDHNIYFFDGNGNMQTGVLTVGNTTFIFDTDGKMLSYVVE